MHTEDTVNEYSYPNDTPSLIRTITSLSKEVYDYYTTFRSYMIADNASGVYPFFELWRCSSKKAKKKCDILLTVFGRIPIAQKTTKRNVAQ